NRSATKSSLYLFQLAVSMPDTGETESGLWATPQEHNATGPPGKGCHERGGHQSDLCLQVKMWPTPTGRDHKDTSDCENVEDNGLLSRVVQPSLASGSLNPTWVEWLMGYPLEWTDLKD